MNLKPSIQHLLCMVICLWMGCMAAFAQGNITVKGAVYDPTDEPIIGASVILKGTSKGVTTDIDGMFTFANVPSNGTLVISFVGMESVEIAASDTEALKKVVLHDNAAKLEEVVVVGYGTMKKKDLTGAIVQINPDKIADQNPKTVQDVLRGVPGLQIGYDSSAKGGDASITLRGKNALSTNATPLIVLDGMTFNGELSEINPDDIAQIDILKDASSAAIYGAKAAAGVIIITTKTGKEGKPTINVSANWGFTNKSAYRDFMGVDEYMTYREDWYKNNNTYAQNPETGLYGYYQAGAWVGEGADRHYNYAYPQGYYENPSRISDTNAWASNVGTSGIGLSEGESMMSLYARRLQYDNSPLVMQNLLAGNVTDWNDLTFRTGINQDYNASISGASERTNYYLSFGYVKNEGAVQGNEYRAFRSNMKLRTHVTDWLEIGANINFQDRSDGDIQVDLGSNYWDNNMLRNSPFASLRNSDGGYEQYPMSGLPTNGGYNYYFNRDYYKLEKGYTVLNTIFNVQVNLPFDIKYNFNIAPRYQWFHDRYWMSADLPNASASSQGVNRETQKWFDWNLNNQITWDHNFTDKHRVTLTLVQEAEEHKNWQDQIYARNITPTDVLGFHYISGANKEQSSFTVYDIHSTAASYLGRLFYSYDGRYMITANFRRDGYSGFGRNNQWGNFGSIGLGWNFADEKWFEQYRTWFNQGKLRVSYGTNGNRDFGGTSGRNYRDKVYATLAQLSVGNTMVYPNYGSSGNTVFNSLVVNTLASPNLEWEKTRSWNVGLDFAFFNYRLSGNIDWYYKDTKDMVLNQRLPSFIGFSSTYSNLGEVTNKGIEIALNSVNVDTRNFTWNTAIAFSYNKSEIKHIYYEYDEDGNEVNDTSNGWYIGKSIGEIWDYETDGVWQNTPADIAAAALVGQKPGDPKVINHYTEDDKILEDGTRVPVYNDKDKVYLGTTTPPIYWSMRNDFTLWKNLSVSVSMYSYMGHKSLAGYWLNSDNGGSQVINAFNMASKEYWTVDNPTNDYCRLEAVGPTGVGSPQKLYNRNFLRLSNISIGYLIPQSFTRRFQIEKLRITASCDNVCTISGWKYGDPENGGLGVRTFNLGVNITL